MFHGLQMRHQAEAAALYQAAIAALPEPFRADGPRLAFEFDDPPGVKKPRKTPAGSRPTSGKPAPKRKRPVSNPAAPEPDASLGGDAPQGSEGMHHEGPASEDPQGMGQSEMDYGWEEDGPGEVEGDVQV